MVVGGTYDKSKGWYIHPTVLLAKDPKYVTMCEELFGPVLTVYVYEDAQYEQTLSLVDQTGTYALTGAIFSQDRYAIDLAMRKLTHAAGNFYINDKCTGAVVGQQPFGGAALRVRTTRRVPSSTCCAGFRPAPSRKPSFPDGLSLPLPPGRKRQR